MKSYLFTIVVLFFTSMSFAQQANSQKATLNKMDIDGYTIKIIHQHDGSFGYLIYKGKEHFVRQLSNPFTNSFRGLQKKEDAFTTARWIVKNIIAKPAVPTAENREYLKLKLSMPLPKTLAEQLHVNIK